MHTPGQPGISPTSTSGDKDPVGTALGSPRSMSFALIVTVTWAKGVA